MSASPTLTSVSCGAPPHTYFTELRRGGSSRCGSVFGPISFRSSKPNTQSYRIVSDQMAPSFSPAKRFLSFALHRRGYAVASDVSVRGGMDRIGSRSGSMVVGKIEKKGVSKSGSEGSSAWAPDPVTGYYRPINHTNEIDPVELRKMFLNHKVRSSSP